MAQIAGGSVFAPSIRVGVDLVRVEDVTESIARFGDRYLQRVFTADEIDYCRGDVHRSAERFAARFAAKEAALKVIRPSEHEGVSWRSIEVQRASSGACEIALRGAAALLARRAGIAELSVCVSHEHAYAIATVIARLAPARDAHGSGESREAHIAGRAGGRDTKTSWKERGADGA